MVQLLKNLERACEGLAHGKGPLVLVGVVVLVASTCSISSIGS